MSIVGLERALHAYVKDSSHTAPFDLKTVPLATTPMQEQVIKAGKPGSFTYKLYNDFICDFEPLLVILIIPILKLKNLG